MELANYRYIILFCILLFIQNSYALTETDIYQYDTNNVDPVYLDRLGQTFTLTNLHRDSITGVEFGIRKVSGSTPGTGTVRIYSTAAGTPSTEIDSATFASSAVGLTCSLLWVSTSTTLADPDASVYAFTVEGTGAGYELCDTSANPYAGGMMWVYSGGSWSSYSSYDVQFSTSYYYNNHLATAATITSPSNGATDQSLTLTISWNAAVDSADTYADTPIRYEVGNGGFVSVYSGCEWTTSLFCQITSGLAYNTTYTIIVQGQDYWDTIHGSGGYLNSAAFTFTTMTEPIPDSNTSSITNLEAIEVSTDYLIWNWTNPSTNYSHVMVYKNGAWVTNVSNSSHGVSFLYLDPYTNYTISTRAVSVNGDINSTWVNATTKTLVECGINEICHLVYSGLADHWFIGNTFMIPVSNSSQDVGNITSIQMIIRRVNNTDPCVTIYDLDDFSSIGGGCGQSYSSIENNTVQWAIVMAANVNVTKNHYYAFYLTAGDVEVHWYDVGYGNHTFPPYGNLTWSDNSVDYYYNSNFNANYIMSYTLENITPSGPSMSDTLYVAKNGSNTNDGLSWVSALLNVSLGVDFINTNGHINIGWGNYTSQSHINGSKKNYYLKCNSTGYKENASLPGCYMPRISI